MEEIKVGEYVRTVTGSIDKVDALYDLIENTIHLENHKWQDIKNIVKHSFNIIDLIEVGDVVKVLDIDWVRIIGIDDKDILESFIEDVKEENWKILSIVTHEQFQSVEYRLEE